MAHLLALLVLDVAVGLGLMLTVMLLAGWRPSELRDVVLNDAWRSFTYEGEPIPGLKPSRFACWILRTFAEPGDARLTHLPPRRHAEPHYDRLQLAEHWFSRIDGVVRARTS